ncbi:concanavalin A-like lectin/glucanase domain-containing protein [Clohesyomyces aquaticus]|uniref:Concanavalin A-like lectin/glucanase domain-containing protein n=1 Tax=Clohesyomyces aquaticus TaxID=1231657 RepID=A0A1Y1Z2E4_9PLEO|nr:concanavalin A-like lectin/glucanase domain-containing protein [Clohesyomyces aquaticus]
MRSSLLGSFCFLTGAIAAPAAFSPAAFDQNRGGAVLKAPEGDSFASVTGTFTVPPLTGTAKLSLWVGIGESTKQNIVLKGGVTYDATYSTFAAWSPNMNNVTVTTSAASVAANDTITVTVSVESETSGTVVLENKTQNKKSTQVLTAPLKFDPVRLTALTADWFVQAYQANGELVQVPRFGTIAFTACSATLKSGKSVGATGAGTFEIQGTSGQIYSKTTVTADGISLARTSM